MPTRLLFMLCAAFLIVAPLHTAEPSVPPAQSYALLIGGLPGSEPYTHWYEDWLGRFQKHLVKSVGVPAANVTVLSGGAATSEAILKALGALAQRVKPQDQFILFIVGHGEASSTTPILALPGPDLSAPQLAEALRAIASQNQVILNFSAISGDFLKHLVSPVRVNLTATSPSETEEPVFTEFFLRGLESKRADPNGPITLLKAFNWAAYQTCLWTVRWKKSGDLTIAGTGPKMWKASGRETVEIFKKLYGNAPGRNLDPSSDAKADDAAMDLMPPGGIITPEWVGRRTIDEHALLEDCGVATGVSVLSEAGGYQPVLGEKPKDPGYAAGHTVLGKP